MWNMMCDVMPTISEDSISSRSSAFSSSPSSGASSGAGGVGGGGGGGMVMGMGEDANFEKLMVTMLDERDKLVENLTEARDRLADSEAKLSEVERERDALQRQLSANLPQNQSVLQNIV
ncbi:hypothetical protein J437_LFUL010866 [Ladona fulva]|uniref:Uncharacterized protein n=1 Tax=Ladona fulva TaxID=123851 RepID=A0A8K0P2P1_LADFU|nr:hypothetical protein J437_LFUL010866 [Ladona fulva]